MSETTGEPGTPESPKTPPSPETPSTPQTSPAPGTQSIPAAAAGAATPPNGPAQQGPGPTQQWAAAGPPAARRSMWGEAMSTTGGTIAVIVAAASLGLIALLGGGLVVGAAARHFDGEHGHGPWAGDSREMPGPFGPGQRGSDEAPRGQVTPRELPGAGDLPSLGLLGIGRALHGEAVVPSDGDATRTILFQRGQVIEVTADKLTVKSTDDFSATYTIGADSRERLKNKVSTLTKGDEVTVIASKDGNETLSILKTRRAGTDS